MTGGPQALAQREIWLDIAATARRDQNNPHDVSFT
jgi:hypothetical protein